MSYFDPNAGRGGGPGGVGGGGGEFRVVVEESDIILQGETDTYDLPDPPAGKRYEYLEFDFLAALNTLAADLTAIASGSVNRTSGQYIHDSLGNQSSWYRSQYASGTRTKWYSGGNTEITETATTMAVGVVHQTSDSRVWTIEYSPAENQLSFWRGGNAPSTNYNPIVHAALITAFVVNV